MKETIVIEAYIFEIIMLIIDLCFGLYVAKIFFYDEVGENTTDLDSNENEAGYRDYNPFIFKDIVK